MSNTKERILSRLKQGRVFAPGAPYQMQTVEEAPITDTLSTFVKNLEAAQAEAHQISQAQLLDWLNQRFKTLESGSVWVGDEVLEDLGVDAKLIEADVNIYRQEVGTCKQDLFERAEVGITTAAAGIASSGSLVIWPSDKEPRLLSLVPAIHIAIIFKAQIYDNFSQVMRDQHWSKTMPSNVVLVSGPSKTADIEQVLAYGVHGPSQLITLIIT